MKKFTIVLLAALLSSVTHAAEYAIDVKGAHAFINFKTSHLGFSWLTGRFNDFPRIFFFFLLPLYISSLLSCTLVQNAPHKTKRPDVHEKKKRVVSLSCKL